MPINHDKKLFFLHIPKCAGTTIEENLLNINTSDNTPILEHLWGMALLFNPWPRIWQLQHIKIHDLVFLKRNIAQLKEMDFSEYHLFTIYRNPYDRIISEYTWIQKIFPEINGITFDEYVKGIDAIYDNSYFCHIESQYDYIRDYDLQNFKSVNFLKFENLQNELNLFCDKLELPRLELPVINKTQHKEYKEFFKNVSKYSLNWVHYFYGQDFDFFGYDKELL